MLLLSFTNGKTVNDISTVVTVTVTAQPDVPEPPDKAQDVSAVLNATDVTISDLREAIYPAASFSIRFDSSRLEFLGVKEGNVFILDDKKQMGQQLPDWRVNVQWNMILAYYVSEVPMDLIHAAATVICILIAADPTLEKLDRIMVKDGLDE